MKFYIAARFALKDLVREIYRKIQERGHEVIGDWTVHKETKPYDQNLELAREYAIEDIDSARNCDCLVLVSDSAGTGMYAELGVAISSYLERGKPMIYVIGDNRARSMFFFHPSVNRKFSIIEEILDDVDRITKTRSPL